MASSPQLSKSRFVSGLQCEKQLWWKVHDPDAPELVAGPDLQAVFDRGNRVGEFARTHVPGGILIDLPHYEISERVTATARALAEGAKIVYEASFLEDGVFVSVDILERKRNGYCLVEVKSTLSVKEQHIPDVAIQLHVLRKAGLAVNRAELMHLNRECRYPDLSNLFVRKNVTPLAEALLRGLSRKIRPMLTMLTGKVPRVETGAHCDDPYECPFRERCWPAMPAYHVSTIYSIRTAKCEALIEDGCETIYDLPEDYSATGVRLRQIKSVRAGKLIVEDGLAEALDEIAGPVGYLDFETIAPAIPAWSGYGPYQPVPVQFSYHIEGSGGLEHHAWLAEGSEDPRESLARALVVACSGAETILAYNASFEKQCIKELGRAVPQLRKQLTNVADRIEDLLPIVRNHVYHPDFGGSFSLKSVLPALVSGLGYDDLEVQDGQTASGALEALLFSTELSPSERKKLRGALLDYCERDTLAMVRLHEALTRLSKSRGTVEKFKKDLTQDPRKVT